MSIQKNRYDWVAYYMAAYEEERKKNTQMAGRIADAERKQADLQDNLNRICANPLYRIAAKASAPLRGAVRRMRGTVISEEELSKIQASEDKSQHPISFTPWEVLGMNLICA